jgi:hypothetical protein
VSAGTGSPEENGHGDKNHIFMIQLVIVLLACTRTDGLDPVNKSSAGLALRGYDTVAYFTENNHHEGES